MTMTPKDHLTPTPVVDKNGKWTTVYRKLFGSKNKTTTPVPAPTVATPAPTFDRAPSIENLRLRAEKSLQEIGQVQLMMHEVMVQINKYPDDLLQRLNKAIDNDVPNLWMIDRQIGAALPHNRVSESLYFLPRMDNQLLSTAQKHLRSLHAQKGLAPSEDYSKEPEEVRQQCLALMSIAQTALWTVKEEQAFEDPDSRTPYVFKDARLTELIIKHADKAEVISSIIDDRKTIDPDTIENVLFSDAPALSEGML